MRPSNSSLFLIHIPFFSQYTESYILRSYSSLEYPLFRPCVECGRWLDDCIMDWKETLGPSSVWCSRECIERRVARAHEVSLAGFMYRSCFGDNILIQGFFMNFLTILSKWPKGLMNRIVSSEELLVHRFFFSSFLPCSLMTLRLLVNTEVESRVKSIQG